MARGRDACPARNRGTDWRSPLHRFPFASSALDLGSFGYVEQEFDFSGTAQAYVNTGSLPFGDNGHWDVVPNPGVAAAYTLRMLVRRPSDPRKFNGAVIVEWLNDTAGFDSAWDWQYLSDALMHEGYAYVGVTAQYVGALALQAWEAGQPGDRYASINHPGDSFSYDIFSQAGRAILHARAGSAQPLGTLTGQVRALLATGYSQSANLLFTYVNAVQSLAHVYDGFLIHSAGYGYPISTDGATFDESLPAPPGVPATPFIDTQYPAFIRTDTRAPVLMIAGEFDELYLGVGASVHNQADSGAFHLWEIVGMTHFDPKIEGLADLQKTYPGSTEVFTGCDVPPANTGQPGMLAVRAAAHALEQWVRTGTPPNTGPRMIVDSPDPYAVSIIHRDPATNIALAGIRLPPVAAPTGTLTGDRPAGAWITCFPEAGAWDPWDRDHDAWDGQADLDPSPTPEPDLGLLYPTHGVYVRRVVASALSSVKSGFLLPRDAVAIVRAAAMTTVP